MSDIEIKEIISNFRAEGEFVCAVSLSSGHINDTSLVTMRREGGSEVKYILQRINDNVFKRPDQLMENYVAVTGFIRAKIEREGGDPEREVINVIPTVDGAAYYRDSEGRYWRVLVHVTDSVSYDKVERPEQFYDSAVAFGNFQYMLRDYPADTLHETIVNFHNTPDRYRQLMEAVEGNAAGRLDSVKAEVDFAMARFDFCHTLERAHREGRLPLRVTHNDTKLNNILFDAKTGASLCVVDLDTIMPGYSVNDFGDSIRFGASTAAEDETDLTKMELDLNLFRAFTRGFLEAAVSLTDREVEVLPLGAYVMTLETAMRFLTDYLEGDVYYKTQYPDHNLIRARSQMKLLSDMERKMDEMERIVAEIRK